MHAVLVHMLFSAFARSAVTSCLQQLAADGVAGVGHDAALTAHLDRAWASLAAVTVAGCVVRAARLLAGAAETLDTDVPVLAPTSGPAVADQPIVLASGGVSAA